MSWRLVLVPYHESFDWLNLADWILQPEATDEDCAKIAEEIAWKLPLKIFVCDPNDRRLNIIRNLLQTRYAMSSDEYVVYLEHGGFMKIGSHKMSND